MVARAPAFEDREFEGEIASIGTRIDTATRAVTARAILPNPERILKPGILMTVELFKNPRQTVVIDEEALIPSGRGRSPGNPESRFQRGRHHVVEAGQRPHDFAGADRLCRPLPGGLFLGPRRRGKSANRLRPALRHAGLARPCRHGGAKPHRGRAHRRRNPPAPHRHDRRHHCRRAPFP